MLTIIENCAISVIILAMEDKFLKPYNPQDTEERIYSRWEESGYFNPDNLPGKREETFTIMLPPPNATGILHLGHALEDTIQDALIRFSRMRGKNTLWLPGTDHAAIATNTKVEKELVKNEGKNRHDIGREAFLHRVEEYVAESRGTIQQQIRRMGASCDWSREAFTFDEKRSEAVVAAFKQMYDAGLIYRGHRVINWDPKGQTTVSDDEVLHREETGKMYTFTYGKEFPIPIATTRPETKVGDTAVAVHPDDSRYQAFIGKEFRNIPFAGSVIHIKVVGDTAVDPAFGTGAVGVTPAHSITDADIARRHGLPILSVINEHARMNENAGELLKGKKTKEARALVVAWLNEQGLLKDEKEVVINVSTAERSGGIIEPLPKLQWFVNVNQPIKERGEKTLKMLMREPVMQKEITIIPERFEKIYFHWIDNLRDWCISRQLWYGHRIPVWYRGEEAVISKDMPQGSGWVQDEDTLDTWFSSALWTFSTLGWPKETEDLKTYHPTTVMAPGYEILFFWVARMILMSTFLLGTIPFKTVYLHGILRDKQGRKFSKSLGNGIDPIQVIEQYGADALRMSLMVGIGPGNDANFDEQKVKAYKHFANKIWNASRLIISETGDIPFDKHQIPELTPQDQKYIEALHAVCKEITQDIESFRLYLASEKLYHYFWHTFADVIIEESKANLRGDNEHLRKSSAWTLQYMLTTLLTLLHPFMPFITEEIWQSLPFLKNKEMLMITPWPTPGL